MRDLFATLQERRRPEDIAEMVRAQLGGCFSEDELAVRDKEARHSVKRSIGHATSMLETFREPVAPARQVRKALELFHLAQAWTAAECADPARVETLLRELSPIIGREVGDTDFKEDRLNRAER